MKGKRAPLMPREHGAYAMLTFPALTALFLGEVRSAPLLLVAATVATFLAHEQVTILTGGRGGRVKSEHGKTARWRALLLGVLASALGIAGLWLGGEAPGSGRSCRSHSPPSGFRSSCAAKKRRSAASCS